MNETPTADHRQVPEPPPLDVVAPDRIAMLVEDVGVRKCAMGLLATLTLAVLAGAFISLGAMFYTLVVTGSELGFGPTRLLGGLAFSLGLVMVVIGGAELFTGNNLIVMAWADGRVDTHALLRNWGLVYLGNFAGALGTVVLVHTAGTLAIGGGGIADTARAIAEAKVAIPPLEAFARGVLCNVLVCLAVWMCFAANSVPGKAVAILFPVSAFVALGFEHSIANMYLIPIGALQTGASIGVGGFLGNLVPVTAGNMFGGGALVALVYWLVYLRPRRIAATRNLGGRQP